MPLSIIDRTAHVAAWESSGLSQAAYCRQAGLAYHLLRDWVRRRSAEQELSSGFVEVRRPAAGVLAVLTLSGGARLAFTAQADQAYIPEILAALQQLDSDLTATDGLVALTPAAVSTTLAATDPLEKKSTRRRPPTAGGRNQLPADIERRHSTYTPPADPPMLRHALSITPAGTTTIERWSVGKIALHIDVMTCPVVRLHLRGGITTQQTLTPPSVIERGQVSDDLLVQSAVDKVVDHLPAHRQEQRAARIGAVIPRAKHAWSQDSRWHIALATFLGGGGRVDL